MCVAHEERDAARCHPMSIRQIVREHRKKGEARGPGAGRVRKRRRLVGWWWWVVSMICYDYDYDYDYC